MGVTQCARDLPCRLLTRIRTDNEALTAIVLSTASAFTTSAWPAALTAALIKDHKSGLREVK